jgi:hypothetical protein
VTITTAAGVAMTGTPDEEELAELYASETSLPAAVCLALVKDNIDPHRQQGGFDYAGRAAIERHYPFTSPSDLT